MREFIKAYVWLYGTTKKQAKEVFKNSDIYYHREVIYCFKDNAKRSFEID